MGSSPSNQNRVASAGLSREHHATLNNEQNINRPQSSSPEHSKSEHTFDWKHKRKRSSQKTEVTPLSPTDVEDKNEPHSMSVSYSDQQKKLKELELQLAKSESEKLDLQEQLNGLKQNNSLKKPVSALPPLEEHGHPHLKDTVFVKDQYIFKLEKDLQSAQKELASVRQRLKKRIKALTNQLHEVRQEASINQMELKAEISQQNEQIEKLKSSKEESSSKDMHTDCAEGSSHSKIIVELSNQLSEQADYIASLEAELAMKSQKIQELLGSSEMMQPSALNSSSVSTDRLPSGRGKRNHKNSAAVKMSLHSNTDVPDNHRQAVQTAFHSHEISPILERQSTALSDSDSDWELDSVPSKVHSAPAGTRIKSAVSVSSSLAKDSAIDMQGNDDCILNTVASQDCWDENNVSTSNRRAKTYKKSALKTHLEKKKNVNQTNALIGPSLAFATKSKEPPSDTSCEPTPRCADRSHLPGFKSLHVVDSVSH